MQTINTHITALTLSINSGSLFSLCLIYVLALSVHVQVLANRYVYLLQNYKHL